MPKPLASYVPAIVLLAIALFFFSPYLKFEQIPYAGDYTGSDLTELNIPLRFLAAEQVKQGKVPLWSDALSSGFPLLAEGQAGVFYPLNLLHYGLFPFIPGIVLGLVLHYFLAAWFTYLLCREYRVSKVGSLIAALAFGFGSVLIFRIKHVNLLNAAVWLPLAVLWVERMHQRERGGLSPAWLALTLAVQFFAGHAQVSFITLVTCVVYAAMRMVLTPTAERVSWVRALGRWLIAGVFTLGLVAIQFLPTYEMSRVSARGGNTDVSFATVFSYHPKHLLTFLNPYVFGNPAENTYALPTTEGGFWESSTYMGLLPFFLSIIGIVVLIRRDKVVGAWVAVGVLSALFITGKYNPLFPFFWDAVPGADLFRFHHRFFLAVILGMAVIAGKGWDWLIQRFVQSARGQQLIARAPTLLSLCAGLVVTLVVVDLFAVSARYVGALPAAYFSSPPQVGQLLPATREGARVFSVGWERSWAAVFKGVGGWRTDAGIYGYHREVLPPNIGAMFGIASVDDRAWQEGGQTVKWLSRLWATYLPLISRDEEAHAFRVPAAVSKLWGMQGARYFLSFFTLAGPDLSLTQQVALPWFPAVKVYENAKALPRAWFVPSAVPVGTDEEAAQIMAYESFDPRYTVLLTETGKGVAHEALADSFPGVAVKTWDNGRIALAVDAPAEGYVVISQTYYPGWVARVDGEPVLVERANIAFQAVAVKEGHHAITLTFRPASFTYGMAISLATLFALLAYGLWHLKKRHASSALPSAYEAVRKEGEGNHGAPPFAPYAAGFILIMLGFAYAVGLYRHAAQLLAIGCGIGVWLIALVRKERPPGRFPWSAETVFSLLTVVSITGTYLFDGGMYLYDAAGKKVLMILKFISLVFGIFYGIDLILHSAVSAAGYRQGGDTEGAEPLRSPTGLRPVVRYKLNAWHVLTRRAHGWGGRAIAWLMDNKFTALVALAFVMRLLIIWYVPEPMIDVHYVMNEGAGVFMEGRNPYASILPNPFGKNEPNFLADAYTYLPGMILLSAPFVLLFGDVRFGYLIIDALIAWVLYRIAGRGGNKRVSELVALTFLFIPHSLFVIEQTWNEHFLILFFTLLLLAWQHRRVGWVWALAGILCTLKQTMWPLIAFLWMAPLQKRVRGTALALVLAAGITLPFFIWGPSDFLHDAILWHIHYDPPPYALTLNSFVKRTYGHGLPGWVFLATAAVSFVLIMARIRKRDFPRVIAGFLTFIAILFFLWYAFPNYYYLLSGFVIALLALMAGGDAYGMMKETATVPMQNLVTPAESASRKDDASAPVRTTAWRIVLVMPAYDAGNTIDAVFARIPRTIGDTLTAVIVVNDGSSDNTKEKIERLQRTYGTRMIMIDKEKNEGYARAQKSGFQRALDMGADIAVLLHADGQYAPEEMPRLLEPLVQGEADMVLGSRMVNKRDALKGGMPFYKWIANICLSGFENTVYGLHFSEYHSGYMLYSRKALETIPFSTLSDTFHFDGEMLFVGAKKGLRVKELSIPTHYGEEKSHLKPIQYGINVLKIMWRYKRGHYNL